MAWWERRWFLAAALLASVLPLLWPAIPPLDDVPGHIGRYHIAAALSDSPLLQRHWDYRWAVIGNLGVDIIAIPLVPLIGAELAARLVILCIPPLFVIGLAAVSRAGGGRLSPAFGFAVPLAYAYPFQLGFVNFMLSAALALLALALWMRLAARPWARAILFAGIAWIVWIAHSSGWGLLGLTAFASEVARRRREGWARAMILAAFACLPMALPLIAMAGGAGGAGFEWDWQAKAVWLSSLLRDRWKWFDIAAAILLFALLWFAVRDRRVRFDAMGGTAAVAALIAFALLPRLAFGGAYVDMRMLAPGVGLALVAIRSTDPRLAHRLALGGAAFLAVRTLATVASFILYAQLQRPALAVVPQIPRGAAVLVLVNEACTSAWHGDRLGHIAGIAAARRDIFENGQWALGGQQLLRARHARAEPYRTDPSQLVYPATCAYRQTDAARALAGFDRATFSHVWTLGFPARDRLAPDLRLVAASKLSALYRVEATSRVRERLSRPAPRP